MGVNDPRTVLSVRVGVGLATGAMLIRVNNFAFEGEVSPIVVVAMLLAGGGAFGAVWGRRGWVPAVIAWVGLPPAHLINMRSTFRTLSSQTRMPPF